MIASDLTYYCSSWPDWHGSPYNCSGGRPEAYNCSRRRHGARRVNGAQITDGGRAALGGRRQAAGARRVETLEHTAENKMGQDHMHTRHKNNKKIAEHDSCLVHRVLAQIPWKGLWAMIPDIPTQT